MKFEKILVIESIKSTENHKRSVSNIRNILNLKDVSYEWINYNELSSSFFNDIDLVVTIGGDGVFIRASHFVRDVPILGLNSDEETSEGALKELSAMDSESFNEVLDGNYDIIQRTRARIILNGERIKELAVNEVYVGAENQFHVSRYIINYNGTKEEQRSSGVLISTGTGSGAWYNSAGGEKFGADSEKLKFVVREPFSAKLFRPEILDGEIDSLNEISLTSKRSHGGVLAIDGSIIYPFNQGHEIKVKVSTQKLNVIIRKS
jgi:NAD kinase